MNSNIYLIGCGGVGSWLAPALTLLTSPSAVIVMDADKLEEKNLDRQLFSANDIGRSKAEALAERYKCGYRDEWFCDGLIKFSANDWIISCVDNHRARRAALNECDRYGCRGLFAANETHSAEAYYYQREWRDGPLDPRKYYPDILTDHSNDPRARAAGCTGEAQKDNPQLVTSNSLAASLAGHLFALWQLKAHTFSQKTLSYLPYLLRANMTGLETLIIKDKLQTKGQTNEHRKHTARIDTNTNASTRTNRDSGTRNTYEPSAVANVAGACEH